MNNIAGTEEKLSWLLTCLGDTFCLISAEGAGVAGLSGLVESLSVLGLEVVPQVLHVLPLLPLPTELRPGLHCLAERLIDLPCEGRLLLPLVERRGCPVILQSLSLPGPSLAGAGVRDRLHRAPVKLTRTTLAIADIEAGSVGRRARDIEISDINSLVV